MIETTDGYTIQSIVIQNFKGIARGEFTGLKRINVLIGGNNAGKSTVLDALRLFRLIPSNQLAAEFLRRRVVRNTWTSSDFFWNYELGSTALVEVSFNNAVIIGLRLQSKSDGTISVEFLNNHSTRGNPWQISPSLAVTSGGVTPEEAFGDLAFGLRSIEMFDNFAKSNVETAEGSHLQRVKHLGADNAVAEAYALAYREGTVSWEMLPYAGGGYRMSIRGSDRKPRFIDSLGDGARGGFLLLATALALRNSWLLIEEIENHQHPSALREIIGQLDRISKDNNIQLFITTHSPDAFRYFSNLSDVSLLYLERSKDGIVTPTVSGQDDLAPLINIGWDIGNILKAEKFVLVEGPEDLELIKHSLFKTRQRWPEELGITMIPYGGISKLATVLKAIMFPARELHVIRDLDKGTRETVVASIIETIENHFRSEGYGVGRSNGILRIVRESTGQTLELVDSNIHVVGDPGLLPSIKSHSFEDYLILMECKARGEDASSLKGDSAKSVLHELIQSSAIGKKIEILTKCPPSDYPDKLRNILAVFSQPRLAS